MVTTSLSPSKPKSTSSTTQPQSQPPQAQSISNKLTIQEKLLLSQAVHKLGAISWPAISNLLINHPCCLNRPHSLFSPESCEGIYMELMGELGVNVPAPDAMKPFAKTHLRLAQTYYLKRMEELQESITQYENKFKELMIEINSLKNGESDNKIRNELRVVIARKYGKRLLDTWFPTDEEVKGAVDAGPVTREEEEAEKQKQVEKNGESKVNQGEIVDQKKQEDKIVDGSNGTQEHESEKDLTSQEVSANQSKRDEVAGNGIDQNQDVEMIDGDKTSSPQPTTEAPTQPEVPAESVEAAGEPIEEETPVKENQQETKEKEAKVEKIVEDEKVEDVRPGVPEIKEQEKEKETEKDQDMEEGNAEGPDLAEAVIEDTKPETATLSPSSPMKSPTKSTTTRTRTTSSRQRRFSPAVSIRSELSPAPGSELSPPPSDQPTPTTGTAETPAQNRKGSLPPTSTRSNKRKASVQPKGVPTSKRAGRRSTVIITSPAPSIHDNDEEGENHNGSEQEEGAEDEEEEVQSKHNTRGKRSSTITTTTNTGTGTGGRRESTRNINKRSLQDSPTNKTKDSSPAVSRRAPSVSSTRSTPGPHSNIPSVVIEERRSSRRSLGTNKNAATGTGAGTRGKRDGKSVRGQTDDNEDEDEEAEAEAEAEADEEDEGADEQDAEEDEEEEKKPVRTSTRRRGNNQEKEKEREKEKETPVSTEKRGTRASARTVRDQSEVEKDNGTPSIADISGELEAGTPMSTSNTNTKSKPTQAQRSSQKLLYSLLDTIASHRNGNVFQNPVKKTEAKDYYQIIKRPMDLKTIRNRIKEGTISGVDEFERDVLLIFANAMMYNDPDSQVYEMAKEMLKSTEDHIAHFRNLQHHVSR